MYNFLHLSKHGLSVVVYLLNHPSSPVIVNTVIICQRLFHCSVPYDKNLVRVYIICHVPFSMTKQLRNQLQYNIIAPYILMLGTMPIPIIILSTTVLNVLVCWNATKPYFPAFCIKLFPKQWVDPHFVCYIKQAKSLESVASYNKWQVVSAQYRKLQNFVD